MMNLLCVIIFLNISFIASKFFESVFALNLANSYCLYADKSKLDMFANSAIFVDVFLIVSNSVNDLVECCASYNGCYLKKESLLDDFEKLIDSNTDLRKNSEFDSDNKEKYKQLSNDKSGLIAFTNYNQIIIDNSVFSLLPLINYLEDEKGKIDKLHEYAEAIIYRDLTKKVYEEYNELPKYNGTYLNRLVEEYKKNDEKHRNENYI